MTQGNNIEIHPVNASRSERLQDESRVLFTIANRLYQAGRDSESMILLQTARDLLGKGLSNRSKEEILACISTLEGLNLSAIDDKGEATGQKFRQAIDAFDAIGNSFGSYMSLIAEGIRLQNSAKPDEALKLFKKAESLDRTHNFELDSIERYSLQCNITPALTALSLIGNAEVIINQIGSALAWIPFKPCKQLIYLLITKGNYCANIEDFNEALYTYKQAQSVAIQLDDQELQATALARIALCYREWWRQSSRLDLAKQSISYRYQALELYLSIGHLQEALQQWREIVSVFKSLKRVEKARDAAIAGLDIARKSADSKEIFEFASEAAWLTSSLSEYSRAITFYLEAYKAETANRCDYQRVIGEIARNYYVLEDYPAAVEWFEKSCDMLAQIGDVQGELEEREVLAYLLVKLGKQENAVKHLQRARQLARAEGST